MSDTARLLRSIAGEDEWTRHQALERLRSEGVPRGALQELRAALDDDGDASRRTAARMALAALASPGSPEQEEAQRVLREALGSDHVDLRVLAASALGEAADPAAAADLIAALGDSHPNVVAAAADALGVLGHADAVEPLSRLALAGDFWGRAAAVVALGRIGDPAALPTLSRLAAEDGLEEPVVEAVRRIDDPAGLAVLERLHARAGLPALLAAGAVLCSHPDVEPPAWLRDPAAAAADALRDRIAEHDDPAAARLLGLAAPPGALDLLLDLVGPPRYSEAAVAGVLATPPDLRIDPILDRLDDADAETSALLLSLLPPVDTPERIRRLVPLLDDPAPRVRAAAAESLARAPAAPTLPLLRARLDRAGAAPEVVRAMSGLGVDACLALTPLLGDPDPAVRTATADALARCAGAEVLAALDAALSREEDLGVRAALLRASGYAGGEAAIARLVPFLDHDAAEVRLAAIEALAATGAEAALGPLRRLLDAGDPDRLAALRALGDLAAPAGAPLLAPHLRSRNADVRREAAGAAVRLAAHLPPDAVRAMAEDQDEWLRICAARVLARRGARGRDPLQALADRDPSPAVRAEARRALEGGA